MTKDEILKILERARNEARDKYRAEIKGFFGSYARGEENAESDLDVLVEFREGVTFPSNRTRQLTGGDAPLPGGCGIQKGCQKGDRHTEFSWIPSTFFLNSTAA